MYPSLNTRAMDCIFLEEKLKTYTLLPLTFENVYISFYVLLFTLCVCVQVHTCAVWVLRMELR